MNRATLRVLHALCLPRRLSLDASATTRPGARSSAVRPRMPRLFEPPYKVRLACEEARQNHDGKDKRMKLLG